MPTYIICIVALLCVLSARAFQLKGPGFMVALGPACVGWVLLLEALV